MPIKISYRRLFLSFLKLAVFVVTLWYLYEKVLKSKELAELTPFLQTMDKYSIVLLLIVFVMMFLNWGTESLKWRLLMAKFETLPYIRSFKAVWSGITINNWVPNRMAEFAGRILYLKKDHQVKAIASTIAGSFAQMISTLIFGLPAVVIHFNLQHKLLWILLFAFIIVCSLFLFFNSPSIHSFLKRLNILKWITNQTQIIETYAFNELLTVLLLSVLRYLIYVFQFYLLFRVFQIEISFFSAFAGLSSVFLIQTFLPAITLTEIGIRGAVVLYVFGEMNDSVLPLMAAAYSLWLINIIIPSIFGMIFIISLKKKKEHLL